LQALLPQVEDFALHEYLNALAQGSSISPGTFADVAAKLRAYTGLPESYIRLSNLRVPYWRYQTELFRNGGVMIGRYDARYRSFNLDPIADRPDFDPVDSAIDAAFVASGNYYLRQVLGYQTTLAYRPTINVLRQWDWKHNGNLPTNTAQDLAAAMTFNPSLQVFSGNGFFDFATPFYATVYTLNHLMLPPQLQRNISYGFYESGHMVYLHQQALAQFHADLEAWYARVLNPSR
jgi:carboxypeptidase C (cathepsin A)